MRSLFRRGVRTEIACCLTKVPLPALLVLDEVAALDADDLGVLAADRGDRMTSRSRGASEDVLLAFERDNRPLVAPLRTWSEGIC